MIDALLSPQYRFNIMAVPVALTAAAMLALGLFVLFRERRSLVSFSFFLITFFSTIWLACFSALYCASDSSTAYAWARLSYFGIPYIPAAIFQFTISVLRLRGKWQKTAFGCWLASFLFMVDAVAGSRYLNGITTHWWGYYTRLGRLNGFFLVYLVAVMLLSLWLYRRQMRRSEKTSLYHKRARTLMMAFAAGYLAVLDHLPAYGISIYPFGYIAVLFFLCMAAWTIIRYRLIDITPGFAAARILEAMSDGVIVLDRERMVHVINRKACEMFGVSERNVHGRKMDRVIPPEKFEAVYRSGKRQFYEKSFELPNGRSLQGEFTLDLLHDTAGGQAVGILCVIHDITDRKYAEERIRELTRAMENAVEGIMRVSREGKCESVNRAFSELVDRDYSEFAGLPWNCLLYPEDADKSRAAYLNMIRYGKCEFEAKVRRHDGTVFAGFFVLVRCDGGKEHFSGAYCFLKDVTERKARESIENKSDLIATVSHEMRTPLHAVREGISVILEGLAGEVNQEQEEILLTTKSNLDRLVRLVNNALDFQRIEAGLLKLRMEESDVNSIVSETVRSAKALILKSGLEFRLELAEHLPKIVCDKDRITQVLINLIQNAVKYTSVGAITVKSALNGEAVEVSVEDTGIGIKEEELGKLFTKFGQLEDGFLHAKGGAGLGLIISHRIIAEHGGRMSVESEFGKGSRFVFTLPLAQHYSARPQPAWREIMPP